ncbi:MAG: phage tail sheath subtilisin-like domain-containing protein [Chloroflexota bacterium]|nr:phage tail sheath subtilisin-like domain-containing protein [Chloroflexota bacterium]
MSNYKAPDIYIEEVSGGARPIQAVGTSTAGFVGVAPNPDAFVNEARAINNWSQFLKEFADREGSVSTHLSNAVYGFFQNGGSRCYVVNVGAGGAIAGGGRSRTGLDRLEEIDEVAIVVAPGYADPGSYDAVLSHCEKMKDRVAILDAPENVGNIDLLTTVSVAAATRRTGRSGGPAPAEGTAAGGETPATGTPAAGAASPPPGLRPRQSDNGYGAFYFPWITIRDPLAPDERVSAPPSGHIAGVWARTDAARGVHKAPANEVVRGALDVAYYLTREEQGALNDFGVNCIRFFTREGIRVWGARTLADGSSEWRYLNVRRLFNMIEESIADSTRWIVFEPNDRTLWKSIRRDITAFLTRVWRDGALMGATPEEAFFVKCDEETNTPESIDAGEVITLIGIAPVKPAEFVVFRISQYAGGSNVETLGGSNA